MVLLPDTPLRGYKNATNYIVGTILRNGAPRMLASSGDVLTFSIAADSESSPMLIKNSSNGIEQSDAGIVVVFLARSDLNPSIFTKDTYYYVLRIDEGDTGDSFPVQTGNFYLLDLPG